MSADADIVIRGGTVIDGTGSPGQQADVAVQGGRIVGIGSGLSGRRQLDASGQVVSPGFIDIHTHYDAQVFWDPSLTPSSHHGVTTVVAGNCGFSIAPIRPDGVALLARTLQHVEDMSFDTLAAGVPWDEFETFPQYLQAVERRGTALNFSAYVGHTAVRLYVMGEAAYERAATDDEIVRMQAVVAEAMAGGAAGFASSASPTHNGDKGRPVPSRVADLNELTALLQPLREAERGVVALLPGGVLSHQDVFALQREIKRPITWTALLTVKGYPYHEKVIAEHDAAWADGVEVWPQVSCRPLVFQMNLSEPFTLNMRPTFAALMGKTKDERVAAYRDPAWRASAWEDVSGRSGSFPLNWAAISVAESASHPDLANKGVATVAEERGCTPLDVMLDISLDDDLSARFWSVLANDDPDAIAWLLPRDNVLLGLADSGAHVSQLCDACFSTDLLGNWVRERGVMPLERAIHKLTGEPAQVYGMTDRGTLAVGQAADICVFNPDTVAPGPLRRIRDFPADGERLTADAPVGMTHLLVNGVPIRVDGAPDEEGLAARPGVVVRG
ncbi:MAG TPA: amidohydrolase family protein [Acidimicrobiales bacterium]|jgi:N-acyl-D-aspartate/D-glutamate deacylase|nr:amidohydrolase family protein [Acidimicrobiales bacterium]